MKGTLNNLILKKKFKNMFQTCDLDPEIKGKETYTYIHTYIHAYMHACMYICIHACISFQTQFIETKIQSSDIFSFSGWSFGSLGYVSFFLLQKEAGASNSLCICWFCSSKFLHWWLWVCDFCCKKLPFPANFVVCISASKLFFSFNLLGSEFFVSWVEFDFIEAYNQML